ncbi:RES family NAD+ phosphorylase [Acerihabitans sp. TG2]|uniref:RES family NAD+ phosphorylase n=1 Tax=Acerihabitans sp. TG2 TaxID=3096008 RepID=UPI002B2263D0|nr:RES family NAD+ phosphorylase [Acerihabitans sp. TG2]MEA9393225.1 RES family NAD+ phosphorylase [Acerihabitans sp. TG2]
MICITEDVLDRNLAKIKEKFLNKSDNIMYLLKKGKIFYRLQDGYLEGKGVFFNPDGSKSRYGVHHTKGTLYLAEKPRAALGEIFKGLPALREKKLDDYHMATLKTARDLNIVDGNMLMTQMKMTMHDLTTTSYKNTQRIANLLCQFYDGLRYTSNTTGEVCIVLWHEDPNGRGVVSMENLVPLSAFYFNNERAADILTDDLGVLII